MDGIERVNLSTDLVYSPDDGGYYFQRYVGGGMTEVSEVYADRTLALLAWTQGTVTWQP